MTPRQRFIAALERKPLTGRVPHFELVFFLTMEVFGKVHPNHRNYGQWLQMEERERELHRRDMAEFHIATAERFEHSAILVHSNSWAVEETERHIDVIREMSGDYYYLMLSADATFEIPSGGKFKEFAYQLVDDPEKLKATASARVDEFLERPEHLRNHGGADGLILV
jgi:uroporphyrinogen decarboxylase